MSAMNPSTAACMVAIGSRRLSDRWWSRRPATRPATVAPKMMANSTTTRTQSGNEKNNTGAPFLTSSQEGPPPDGEAFPDSNVEAPPRARVDLRTDGWVL